MYQSLFYILIYLLILACFDLHATFNSYFSLTVKRSTLKNLKLFCYVEHQQINFP